MPAAAAVAAARAAAANLLGHGRTFRGTAWYVESAEVRGLCAAGGCPADGPRGGQSLGNFTIQVNGCLGVSLGCRSCALLFIGTTAPPPRCCGSRRSTRPVRGRARCGCGSRTRASTRPTGRPAPAPWPQPRAAHFQVPNQDGAGVVDEVGPGVDPARIGQRVWLYMAAYKRPYGTAAQFTVIPSDQAIPLPDNASMRARREPGRAGRDRAPLPVRRRPARRPHGPGRRRRRRGRPVRDPAGPRRRRDGDQHGLQRGQGRPGPRGRRPARGQLPLRRRGRRDPRHRTRGRRPHHRGGPGQQPAPRPRRGRAATR